LAYKISDITQGLIEILEEISHDPDEADWYDANEYLELLPNSPRVLRELAHYLHENYL
jgi:hypothetical protein